MANFQMVKPRFSSIGNSYDPTSDEEDEEERYKSEVIRVDLPIIYNYIIIKSRHIGCLPLNGNHFEDLDTVSKDKYTLIYIYDKSISDKLRYFREEEKNDKYDDVHKSVSSFIGKNMAYALIVKNDYSPLSVCQFMSILEKAWGEKSRNNLSYISADRVKEEYLLKIRSNRECLVINLGGKL